MSEEDFRELVESVREGGQILRGEREPSRAFEVNAPRGLKNPETHFAVCVRTDDPELLIPRKIYEVTTLASGRVAVLDEAGETAIYPADHFILMELPSEVVEALSRVA